MAKEVRLPKFGDTMEEGVIVDCKVSVGDHVKSGDVLFEVETDKATLEIESPADGFVKQIMAEVGGSYRIETPLLILGDKDERVSDEFLRSLKASTPTTPTIAKSRPAKREKINDLPMPIPVLPQYLKLGQMIQVCVRYRGRKTLSIKLVVQDIHNRNQGAATSPVAPFLPLVTARIREITGLTASEISRMSRNDNRMGDSNENGWMKANNAVARITIERNRAWLHLWLGVFDMLFLPFTIFFAITLSFLLLMLSS